LFGSASYYLNAGTVVVLSGVLVLVASVIMWLVDVHREDKKRERRSAGDPPTSDQPGPSGRTASRASAGDPPTSERSAGDPPTSEQPGPSGRTASRAGIRRLLPGHCAPTTCRSRTSALPARRCAT